MRHWPSALGLVAAMGAASGALGANCADGYIDFVYPPDQDPPTVSVLFDQFVAGEGDQATCALSTPLADALPPGVVAVYQADYRGFINPGAVGELLVLNNGRLVGVVIENVDDFFFQGWVGSNSSGNAIESLIALELLAVLDPADILALDTIDYIELARATTDSLQASTNQLAAARTGVVTHLNGTFDLLNSAGEPLEGDDRVALIGGIGSVTLGVNARMTLLDGFSVLGGAAFVDQESTGASTSGALFGASMRYVAPVNGTLRPFAEAGLKVAPALNLRFSRSYETSAGTSTPTGSTTGSFYGGFLKGGVLVAPDLDNDIVFSAALAQDWLATAAYEETLDGTNLFAASVPAQTGAFTTVKAGVDWTTRPATDLSLTFSGALGYTLAHNEVSTAIAFVGDFTSAGVSESFVEYGARAAYRINHATSIGAFVHGVTGAVSGTHVQVGGDARVSF
jgi:hypothetical protein